MALAKSLEILPALRIPHLIVEPNAVKPVDIVTVFANTKKWGLIETRR